MEKTNVMRVLDGKKIPYESHTYEQDATLSGEEIAGILGEDPKRVFKTLVTRGKSGAYYVFVVPVREELDLKKAAKACGEKAVAMIKQKELLPLTGYVSAGKVGFQIEIAAGDLISVAGCKVSDIV